MTFLIHVNYPVLMAYVESLNCMDKQPVIIQKWFSSVVEIQPMKSLVYGKYDTFAIMSSALLRDTALPARSNHLSLVSIEMLLNYINI